MLAWILLGFAVAIVPFVVLIVKQSRLYPRLLGDAHLDELAATVARLKADAADGRARSAITSEGLALTWDATRPEVRVSLARGRLAPPAAAFFLAYLELLAAPPDGADAAHVLDGGRHVLRLALPDDAADAFREAPITPPAPDERAALRARAADAIRGPDPGSAPA